MSTKPGDTSAEARLIRMLLEEGRSSGILRPDVSLGIGDDAAITRIDSGFELLTATDALVAGTHFLEDAPAKSVGHRVLAANLSDIAAMGGEPLWASLVLSLPRPDQTWLGEFCEGFFALARRFGVQLTGGDTVRGPLAATVSLQGRVPAGSAIRRSGARAGDHIFVTGLPGSAAGGRLHGGTLEQCFYFPEPRVDLGRALRGLASAMIDLSDGVHRDLGRLLEASGVGADVTVPEAGSIAPLSEAAGEENATALFLHGGEDYELCFTAAPGRVEACRSAAAEHAVPLLALGRTTDSGRLRWLRHGREVDVDGDAFEHFD